jgi:polysaccharide export outer membrane protein
MRKYLLFIYLCSSSLSFSNNSYNFYTHNFSTTLENQTKLNNTYIEPTYFFKSRNQTYKKKVNSLKELNNLTFNKNTTDNSISIENTNFVEKLINSTKLEREYSLRAKEALTQFGYDFFQQPLDVNKILLPVSDNYVLGPGDQIIIYFIGLPPDNQQIPPVVKTIIDRQGNISIPGIGVFSIWGLTLKEAEDILKHQLGVNLKLTVGKLRTFPVYITGEVKRPGAHIVTGVNTILDALTLAGVKKTGSLRDIVLTRKTGKGLKIFHIDLYKVFIQGQSLDLTLKDGDTILVKPIGSTAAITGEVKRAAIYEIKKNETIKDLINFAGGLLPSSYKYKVVLQRYKNGKLEVYENSLANQDFLKTPLQDGDLIFIKKIVDIPENAYSLEGYVTLPGIYEYKKGLKISEVLNKDIFFKDTNLKFAILIRQYPKGTIPQYISFSPEKILNGKQDFELKPYDRLIFFKLGEKPKYLKLVKNYIEIEGYYKYTGPIACSDNCKLSQILEKNLLLRDTNLKYAEIERYDLNTLQRKKVIEFKPIDILEKKEDINLQPYDKIILYPRYIYKPIKISGDILNPIWVTYHPSITLEEVISHAKFKYPVKELKAILKTKEGILTFYLNDLRKHPSPLSKIQLQPGSEVIIKKVKEDEIVTKVYVYGQVQRPGVYKINEKTTLYDILKAAGGFKSEAYPKGLVLLRKSIAQMQKERLQKAITILKTQLLKEEAGYMQAEMPKEEKEAYKEAFEAKSKLLKEIEKTQITGRLVGLNIPPNIEALKNSPSNILLEDGDQIYVPKKPSAVLVFGEVQNPSAILYKPNLTVKDYISLAGGFTKDADIEDIFIIKANGIAISKDTDKSLIEWDSKHKRFIWGYAYNDLLNYKLEPGDAIIVPTKIHIPIMWRPLIKDVIQIIYQSVLTVYTISHL